MKKGAKLLSVYFASLVELRCIFEMKLCIFKGNSKNMKTSVIVNISNVFCCKIFVKISVTIVLLKELH